MAFLLRDIPNAETFDRFRDRYPDLDPIATELFLRLLRIGSDYLEYLDGLLQPFGLLHGRWITLILLMREADRMALPSTLAEKQGVSRATMSGLLDGLERDGLIERVPDPADARRLFARLTSVGEAKLDAIMPHYYASISSMMGTLSDSQQEHLLHLLRGMPQPGES
ncbi:MAG: MarR family winged helix-turn-helix transcriptional regulator [Planctomycetota bacterium]